MQNVTNIFLASLFFLSSTTIADNASKVVVVPDKNEYLVLLNPSQSSTNQSIILTVKDKNGRLKSQFCMRIESDSSEIGLSARRICSNKKGQAVFVASAQAAVDGSILIYNDLPAKNKHRQLLTMTTIHFLNSFSASASSTTMYRNQCIEITASGGVAPYIYEKVYDDSNGTFDQNGTFCGGRSGNGNALLRVSDQRGSKVEFLIVIFTPPPGEVTVFYNREPIGEGQCIDLSASGNGGEWFTIVSDPTRGTLWNYGYSQAQYCAGFGSGMVEILVTDQDSKTARAYIQVIGAEILGCTDPSALNYNPQANRDDGSCYYE